MCKSAPTQDTYSQMAATPISATKASHHCPKVTPASPSQSPASNGPSLGHTYSHTQHHNSVLLLSQHSLSSLWLSLATAAKSRASLTPKRNPLLQNPLVSRHHPPPTTWVPQSEDPEDPPPPQFFLHTFAGLTFSPWSLVSLSLINTHLGCRSPLSCHCCLGIWLSRQDPVQGYRAASA